MEFLDRIEDQIAATGLPLFAITLAAVPCPDTPVILTLHWHGFIKEKLADNREAEVVSYTPIPSSALQLNERWRDLRRSRPRSDGCGVGTRSVGRAARASGPVACARVPHPAEALECLQAFGSFPFGVSGNNAVVADAPDADELVEVAARRGYLMWLFRPVCGGIWGDYADDATLMEDGRRRLPCPLRPIPPTCDGQRKTVYRFGVSRAQRPQPIPVHSRARAVTRSKRPYLMFQRLLAFGVHAATFRRAALVRAR